MEALCREFRVDLLWELLHADDLVFIAETEDNLIKRLNEWRDFVQNIGMRVNMNKTNVMISGEWQKVMQKAVRWPCGVCGRGVGNNLIQCTSCQKWVHRKCSGIKGSLYKVMKTFICRGCMIPVNGTARTGASGNLELVDGFCCLVDMLSVDGDADAAVENRVRVGWSELRRLVLLLTNDHVSLRVRGRLYSSCVQGGVLHGSGAWPGREESGVTLQRAEMRMVGLRSGVKPQDRISSKG